MIQHLKTWWATYLPVISAVAYFLLPSLQAYFAAHPKSTFVGALISVIVAHHMTAPKDAGLVNLGSYVPPGGQKGFAVVRILLALAMICLVLLYAGCPKLVQSAVDTLAASQGFIAQAQVNHGAQCKAAPSTPFPCQTINQAIDAQNAAIDALEAYCQLPVRPDPATLKAMGANTCNENPSAKQVLVSALSNISKIIANYKASNGGKP